MVRRDHEVAREEDLESAGERRSVDRGDQRLGEAAGDDATETTLLRRELAALALGDLLQVGTGAERGTRAGEDDDGDRVVGLEVVEDRLHCLGEIAVHRVARLGPVERDDRDPIAPFNFYYRHLVPLVDVIGPYPV